MYPCALPTLLDACPSSPGRARIGEERIAAITSPQSEHCLWGVLNRHGPVMTRSLGRKPQCSRRNHTAVAKVKTAHIRKIRSRLSHRGRQQEWRRRDDGEDDGWWLEKIWWGDPALYVRAELIAVTPDSRRCEPAKPEPAKSQPRASSP